MYVYGIVPDDAVPEPELTGVGDPPGPVKAIRYGQVAALASQVDAPWSVGSPEDLTRHAHILDSSAPAVPVLPMRFGTIMAEQDVVGEIVSRAISAKRENDTSMLAARLDGHCEASVVRAPRHERDAAHMAVLVRMGELDWLQRTVGDLAYEWRRRVDLRLLGPMAAYDFVATRAVGD